MPAHQRDEQAVEHHLSLDQQISRLSGVEMSTARDDCQLVDERLAKPQESFDRVSERCLEARRLSAVLLRVPLRDQSQVRDPVAVSVEVGQQIADQHHASLSEATAFGLR